MESAISTLPIPNTTLTSPGVVVPAESPLPLPLLMSTSRPSMLPAQLWISTLSISTPPSPPMQSYARPVRRRCAPPLKISYPSRSPKPPPTNLRTDPFLPSSISRSIRSPMLPLPHPSALAPINATSVDAASSTLDPTPQPPLQWQLQRCTRFFWRQHNQSQYAATLCWFLWSLAIPPPT